MIDPERAKLQDEVLRLKARVAELEKLEQEHQRSAEALEKKDELFRTLVRTSPFGIQFSDKQGKIIYSNPAHHRIHEYADEELIGSFIWELIADPKSSQETRQFYQVIMKEQPEPISYFSRDLTKTGRQVDLQIDWDYVRDSRGEVDGIISIISDITERKKSEGDLQASEERFMYAMAATRDGLYDWDLATEKIYFSPGWKKMLGYEPHELPDEFAMWEKLLSPEGVQLTRAMHQELILRQRDRFELELKMKHRDGHWVDVLSRARAVFDEKGKAIRVVGTHVDISDLIQAEEREKETLARLRLAMESADEGVWEWDGASNLITLDRLALQMIGYEEDFPPQPSSFWAGQIHEEDRQGVIDSYLSFLKGETEKYSVEFRIERKDQSFVWVASTARVIRSDSDQKPLLVAGIHRDISPRKLAEQEQESLQAQLLQAQKMDSIGRLAGGVAHDFNNKLSVILGYTELAVGQVQPDHPMQANLQEILKATHRSAEITRQLLAFARKQTISPDVLDLNKSVGGMLNMLQRLIGEDINLAWLPGEDLWSVKMDASQVDQVMANLCINARDAISGVGKITIETGHAEFDEDFCAHHPDFRTGQYVMLAVSDDGCGMNGETLANVFEPFFTTKAESQGTGLGLSMVYGIVMQNNGFIQVLSEPDEGSAFKIYLPRQIGDATTIRTGNTDEIPRGKGETIFLVEDEEAILDMATMMLEKLGYRVVAANNPTEALRLAAEHEGEIQLLLTDVVLPEMNGRELCNRLQERVPGLKTLFISGYTANVIAHRGVLENGVDFLHKPFTLTGLATAVNKVLESPTDG